MKTLWLTNLNARFIRYGLLKIKMFGTAVFLVACLAIVSCSQSDEAEIVDNDFSETPVDRDPPNIHPDDSEPPQENEPPVNEEPLIVYTDIEPDFKGEGGDISYDLDINNDQIIDFTINSDTDEGWPYLWITSHPDIENALLAFHPWYAHPVPMDSEQTISGSGQYGSVRYSTWGYFTIGDCFEGTLDCYYNWQLKGDKYVGLRIKVNGLYYYGWVKMNIENATQWTVMDYAFNAVPNSPILAGQIE